MAGRRILSDGLTARAFLPVVADGFQISGKLRQRAEIGLALLLSVVVGARARRAGRIRARYARIRRIAPAMASGDDLDSFAAAVPELRKKRMQLGPGNW